MDLSDALAIYKISSICTEDDLQQRYKELLRKYHPDRNHTHSDWCHLRMTEISEALEIIKDNLPLENNYGWECHYQIMEEDESDIAFRRMGGLVAAGRKR